VRGEVRHNTQVTLGLASESMPRVAAEPRPAEGPAASRISEIERQIERLSLELQRLKAERN
jgi:hypothetical protein